MKGKISYIDQNHFLYQVVNIYIFIFAVNLGILTMGLTAFLSQSLAASQWIAALVTSVLVSREKPGGFRMVRTMDNNGLMYHGLI